MSFGSVELSYNDFFVGNAATRQSLTGKVGALRANCAIFVFTPAGRPWPTVRYIGIWATYICSRLLWLRVKTVLREPVGEFREVHDFKTANG